MGRNGFGKKEFRAMSAFGEKDDALQALIARLWQIATAGVNSTFVLK
jgi:hypothetical protein